MSGTGFDIQSLQSNVNSMSFSGKGICGDGCICFDSSSSGDWDVVMYTATITITAMRQTPIAPSKRTFFLLSMEAETSLVKLLAVTVGSLSVLTFVTSPVERRARANMLSGGFLLSTNPSCFSVVMIPLL